ncbi:prepilin-type N-terminal cleavage/methylation domain-containing protein [Desulfitobacterium sp.]|uniref:type II secretion system protein n=1 Tax=Desulfitobacterium sp. TaxID=49981 RepID=UPI002CD69D58|nr:prepilin-type N-terminal cleavage/methylation domain-containing protein [Desulfitobacterium sp.]HVJ48898.1 prepilin-type N-terminal cleavage/methylation domain-containing protein [Desulfitobacterium sp.]
MDKQEGVEREGFTLVEVLMVVVILSIMAAITIPKISSSSDLARKNADIATAHQVKTALDRYQAENGIYPKSTVELSAPEGMVIATVTNFIPKYISKLDKSTTQQRTDDTKKGFGVTTLGTDGQIPTTTTTPPTHLIMIYLSTDGSGAEVRAYNSELKEVLWTSSN